jgi:hypothetical protein
MYFNVDLRDVFFWQIESNIVRCPNADYATKMIEAIDAVRVRGDSVGGVVTCIARNVPRVCWFLSRLLCLLYCISLVFHLGFGVASSPVHTLFAYVLQRECLKRL